MVGAALSAVLAQAADGPVVAVNGGQIQGRLLPAPGGAAFKGIPYAAPPMDERRWREPQPLAPWSGVLPADAYRPGCGQMVEAANGGKVATEDCLYLNVWTPQWPAASAKKPVMLWINGGELGGGSGSLRAGGESLIRHGVVLVSANYRGTLLGMMGHPELTAESPHHFSANYTIYDEIAVLRWIHDNIARFVGDPSNVTVFSQSGGAHITSILLTSPMTRGLIHRAILDSGAPIQPTRPYLRLEELEQIGVVTAQMLQAPATEQVKFLRGLPASELAGGDMMRAVRARLLEMNGAAYDEGTDGYGIPQPPNEVWEAHKEAAIPLMIGSNGQDTGLAIGETAPLDGSASADQVAAWENGILDVFYGQDADLLQRARQIYGLRGSPNEIASYAPWGTPVQQMGVDLNHRCGVALSAALHSTIAPTYQFEFTRTTPGHPPSHGAELRYLFGYDDLTDDSDRRYSEVMQRYWTNFAKTGNPNGPDLPVWSKYDVKTKPSMDFASDGPMPTRAVRAAACAPFNEKYARHPDALSSGANLKLRVSAAGGR